MSEPSKAPTVPPPDAAHHVSRLVSRQRVLIGVKLRRRGESWFASRVTDISQEGFRLSTFVKLVPGMQLWIMLPGFEGRKATVSWVGFHEAGCAFDVPLHPAILDYILRMSDPKARAL
jgi:hypothetical protein